MLLTFFKPTWKKILLAIVLFFLLLFVLRIGFSCLDCLSCGCELTIKLLGISLYSEYSKHTDGMKPNELAAIFGNETLDSPIRYSSGPSFIFSFFRNTLFSNVFYFLLFYVVISYVLSCT
ncbi:MAG: hypothetical protein AABW64_04465, partial [Nanoarchaeota archaeon]